MGQSRNHSYCPSMEKNMLTLLLHALALLSCARVAMCAPRCGDCGRISVPYPLSTGPGCGEQSYKVRCSAGTLWFDALSQSSYIITSINPGARRMIVKPASLIPNTCMATDIQVGGIQLDRISPYNITSSNTVMLMNCSNAAVVNSSLDCSPNSICHAYIRDNAATAACRGTAKCCWFKTGAPLYAYKIGVRDAGCMAYQSFVNLATSLPVKRWPDPGLEIEWALPKEPICRIRKDCSNLLNSVCLPDGGVLGQKRCFCRAGFRWDSINGLCQSEYLDYRSFFPKLAANFKSILFLVDLKCDKAKPWKRKKKSRTPLLGGT